MLVKKNLKSTIREIRRECGEKSRDGMVILGDFSSKSSTRVNLALTFFSFLFSPASLGLIFKL